MKELFTEIETLVPTLGDWCSVQKAFALAATVLTLRPAVTVEIGVFSGASFLPMAMAHKAIGRGKAYAIDPWMKQASIEGMDKENAEWWASVDHERIYRNFMAKVGHLGVQDWVAILRSRSNEVEPPQNIGLLHVDGNHGKQAITDVKRFAPNVVIGGICWMDDINWVGGGVETAVGELLKMGFVKLYDMDTGAAFQRISK